MSRGFVLWFTGLSGSGKSTLTTMVAAELRRRGVHVETLDGDEIRKHLSKGLGFSREDRDENIRRIGFVAKLVARSGACAIAAAISPYREVRNEVRRTIDEFVEVYTECPIAVLAERDPKGLYKKALAGEIRNFTGVDDPYEAPENAEVHLHTDREPPEESLGKILRKLEELGLIPAWGALLDGTETRARRRLPPPHGSDLVDRRISREAARVEPGLPVVDLDPTSLWDVVSIATGVYSPLAGFMTSKDYLRVVRELRLESGLPWALPIVLPIPEGSEAALRKAGQAALRAPDGRIVGLIQVEDVYRPDLALEARSVLGTSTPPAPRGTVYLGGQIRCFDATPPEAEGWAEPRGVRARLSALGLDRIVAVHSAEPPFVTHEHFARTALEFSDALVVQPTLSEGDLLPLGARVRAWQAVASGYFPDGKVFLATHPRLHAGSTRRKFIHDAIVAKNYGASRLLVLAGGGTHQEVDSVLDCYGPGELGVELLPLSPPVRSAKVGLATTHTAPDPGVPVDTSKLLESLTGGTLDPSSVRPEVLAVLRSDVRQRE